MSISSVTSLLCVEDIRSALVVSVKGLVEWSTRDVSMFCTPLGPLEAALVELTVVTFFKKKLVVFPWLIAAFPVVSIAVVD